MNEEYINTKTARQILGVSTITLRDWDKKGRIKTIRTPSGHRLYYKRDILAITNEHTSTTQKQKVCYCRVSSKKQKDDLDRQIDFFKSKYPLHSIITDIGSGINWKRQGLKTILEQSMSGGIAEVVVAHRDRLCRFGFELIEFIFKQNGVKLIVLDRKDNESDKQDLADDILSIIHIYSCREMGKRRYQNKNKENTSLPIKTTKEDYD